MNKKVVQGIVLALTVGLNLFGILSLLQVAGIANVGLTFYNAIPNLILKYVVIIASMAAGIMLFNVFAGTFKGKLKNGLSIGGCVYSTVLTVPLLLVFIGCFFAVKGVQLPMVNEVADAFALIFKTRGVQYLIFSLGVIMSIIFLAVPILMTVITVKEIDLKKVLGGNKKCQCEEDIEYDELDKD